jgi:hypothetical protein
MLDAASVPEPEASAGQSELEALAPGPGPVGVRISKAPPDYFLSFDSKWWTNPKRVRRMNCVLAAGILGKTIDLSKEERMRDLRPIGKIDTFCRFRLTGAGKLATDG